mgnify:CR=1 FL=1
MNKIYVLILKNRVTGDEIIKKSCKTEINPIDDKLKCLRYSEISEVRSFEEIQEDDYHIDDEVIYDIRFSEIKSVYNIESEELSLYLSKIEEEYRYIELDEMNLTIDIKEYKKSINRDSQLSELLDKKEIIDFLFLELYIKKKYNQKVEDYFNIGKMSISGWRTSNSVPPKRIIEFYEKEGSIGILELFKNLYRLN